MSEGAAMPSDHKGTPPTGASRTPSVRVFGIRHHGPGSARSLRAALERLRPDAVLIEGPPEAAAVLDLAAEDAGGPPGALLPHGPDPPRRAAFYPLATFSPEWQAIRYGLTNGVPVRFIDLPAANWLADRDEEPAEPDEPAAEDC